MHGREGLQVFDGEREWKASMLSISLGAGTELVLLRWAAFTGCWVPVWSPSLLLYGQPRCTVKA